jgi:two-component system, cell cycle response regulator DivK
MKSPKILVIEDNEQNLYLMRFLLEKHGFAVTDARSGREGIEAAARITPDLILLDIQLPLMDGYAVAKALRGLESLTVTPIVVVTSYAMVGDREKALESGATDYIEKPINPATFIDQILKHLPAFPLPEGPPSGGCIAESSSLHEARVKPEVQKE